MGTSKSYGGPSDKTPLLPDWAFPDLEDEESLSEEDIEQQNETPDIDEELNDEEETESESGGNERVKLTHPERVKLTHLVP